MFRLMPRWFGLLLAAVLLAACVQPTPTPDTSQPSSTLPATAGGYPATTPTLPQPTGYPAQQPSATSNPAAYPAAANAGQGSPTVPASSPVPADTSTPAASATPSPVVITYRNFEIVPAETTIKAGTTVVFAIADSVHQPYAGAQAPFIFEAPNNLQPGTSWPYTFNEVRTMTLLCGYHANMSAKLIIEP